MSFLRPLEEKEKEKIMFFFTFDFINLTEEMISAICIVGTAGKPCHGGAETGDVSGTGASNTSIIYRQIYFI